MNGFKSALGSPKPKPRAKKPKGDTLFTVDAQGNPTNQQLHEDMQAGVSGERGEKFAKAQLKKHGLTEALKLLT